jgi:predicted GNAT superfamily acetyltransferase
LGEAPLSDIVVRDVTKPDELKLCIGLYEAVFRLGSGDGSLNTRLLVGIARNSGIIVGAFSGGQMIGFALSFLAFDREKQFMYQYSQLAVVAEEAQGHGVGRQLKLAQRETALSMGISTMRWSFDPFQVRNAHFNLNVLGARAFTLERNLYGSYGHGFDVAQSTDRLIVEWDLNAPNHEPREPALAGRIGVLQVDGDVATLSVMTKWSLQPDTSELKRRADLLDSFDKVFALGFEAIGCDLASEDSAIFVFTKTSQS